MILDTACDGNALATLAALEAVSNQVVEDTQVVALHHKSSSLAAATGRVRVVRPFHDIQVGCK